MLLIMHPVLLNVGVIQPYQNNCKIMEAIMRKNYLKAFTNTKFDDILNFIS